MAHIRHRMCSRRGGSRGGGVRPPVMPSPDSASPSPSPDIHNPSGTFPGRYPVTHSGRGRALLQVASQRDAAVHIANFPLPPHPAPHSTQFRFRSTLNWPIIIATVTIVFSEENEPHEASLESNGAQQRAAHRFRSARDPGKQPLDEGVTTLLGKEPGGSQHVAEGRVEDMQTLGSRVGDTSHLHATAGSSAGLQPAHGLQAGASTEEDDWYQYACRIEEEPAPDDL